jgi:hypothetical protein
LALILSMAVTFRQTVTGSGSAAGLAAFHAELSPLCM